MNQLVDGLGVLVQLAKERVEREASARPAWSGGAGPVSAETPPWSEGSLGARLLTGTYLGEALDAPCVLTAEIPDAATIAANPAHWNIATSALVRAVIFDDLKLDHPTVGMLLEVLTPLAEAELAYYGVADASLYGAGTDWDEDEFPELDGPVFLLGGRALVDAVWAAVGQDPLSEVLGVLTPVLDGIVEGLDGHVVADALIGAFARHYRSEQPGDADVLQRVGHYGGNALENLVAAGAVSPRDILPVGLTLLSALAQLCLSDSASLLPRAV